MWETLTLKREALNAARFDNATYERARLDVVEWLDEALKTKATRQPALYLGVLDLLGAALNQLPVDGRGFAQFWQYREQPGQPGYQLEDALRRLPLPSPRDLHASYLELMDKEVEMRTVQLQQLETRVAETEAGLRARLDELASLTAKVDALNLEIEVERDAIASVRNTSEAEIRSSWQQSLQDWEAKRALREAKDNETALAHLGTLASTAQAGAALAEHAAGNLSATDWRQRSKRERKAAQWMRAAAIAAFLMAGAVGYYIVSQAIDDKFDLTLGDGVLRAAVAIVIGSFGALLLREASRHFRESDTAEDVALSLTALAPFYASSDEDVRHAARVELGDAVLVRNVLSRFSHRDAAKHAAELKGEDLTNLVKETSAALKLAAPTGK